MIMICGAALQVITQIMTIMIERPAPSVIMITIMMICLHNIRIHKKCG